MRGKKRSVSGCYEITSGSSRSSPRTAARILALERSSNIHNGWKLTHAAAHTLPDYDLLAHFDRATAAVILLMLSTGRTCKSKIRSNVKPHTLAARKLFNVDSRSTVLPRPPFDIDKKMKQILCRVTSRGQPFFSIIKHF
jgi:hypothetical protein